MRMLGRADDDRVEFRVLQPVVELAEVAKELRLGVIPGGPQEVRLADVAQGDDVLATDAGEVGPAAAATADDGDIELLVGPAGADERGRAEGSDASGAGTE